MSVSSCDFIRLSINEVSLTTPNDVALFQLNGLIINIYGVRILKKKNLKLKTSTKSDDRVPSSFAKISKSVEMKANGQRRM